MMDFSYLLHYEADNTTLFILPGVTIVPRTIGSEISEMMFGSGSFEGSEITSSSPPSIDMFFFPTILTVTQ